MNKKYNLVCPLNGIGSRFRAIGVNIPKPMIMAGHKTILEWGIDSIDISICNLIFIIRRDQPELYQFLSYRWPNSKIVIADRDTEGSLDTVTLAKDFIYNETPLMVFNSDVFYDIFCPKDEDFEDGTILVFKSNSPNYSYVKEKSGLVIETAEKKIIGDYATTGLYCFKNGKILLDQIQNSQALPNGEHYIAPIYNQLIKIGQKIKCKEVGKMGVIGTPEELRFFTEHGYATMIHKKFILVSDHSGVAQIDNMEKALIELDEEYERINCDNKACDYSDYVSLACDKIINQNYFGIGSCRSGNGVSLAANKYSNRIISCPITSKDSYLEDIKLSISHNCCNFLSLAGKNDYSIENCKSIINMIKDTSFDWGRHQIRLMKMLKYI